MVSAPGGNCRCLRQASDACTVFTIGKLSRSQKGVCRKLFVPLCRQNILKRSACIFDAEFTRPAWVALRGFWHGSASPFAPLRQIVPASADDVRDSHRNNVYPRRSLVQHSE